MPAVTFANSDINWLAVHSTLQQLAWAVAGVFFSVYLIHAGVAPGLIFLVVAGTLMLRFALRPLVMLGLPYLGARRLLLLGSFLSAVQFPVFAFVRGPDTALVVYCTVAALSGVFYWTTYHAYFAALGDSESRGSQLGARQAFATIAGVAGPVLGGFMLARFGAWSAFGVAAALELASMVPLLSVTEPQFAREAPKGAYEATRLGVLLFFTDGWITSCSTVAWDIVAFHALGDHYEAFGSMLAAAALAGAVGGIVFGRFVDAGRARRTAWLNGAALALVLIVKALCGDDATSVVAVAALAAVMGGLYVPALMVAVYDEAKMSPCPMRFQFAAEGGWDIGGSAASLVAAAFCFAGLPLQFAILLALPAVAVQARLLHRHYSNRRFSGVPAS